MSIRADTEPRIDLEALHNAMTFWGAASIFKQVLRLPSTPRLTWTLIPRIARLPAELQFSILDFLRPKDIDVALNFAFAHFVPEYFRLQCMSSRFIDWANNLCSRNNLRHLVTLEMESSEYEPCRWEIYRLKAEEYNRYPQFSMRPLSWPPDLEPLVPSLDLASFQLFSTIERMFWKQKMGRGYGRNPILIGTSRRWRRDSAHWDYAPYLFGYYEGSSHAEERFSTLMSMNTRCLLIPMDSQPLRQARFGDPFDDFDDVDGVDDADSRRPTWSSLDF